VKHIEELLQKVIDQAAAGKTGYCITLESREEPKKWVQFTWDTINAAYPFVAEPSSMLRELKLPDSSHLELSGWEPNTFATFEHPADQLDRSAMFVAAYFDKVLGVSAKRSDLRVTEQEL
jgi:hypothetical protein